MCDTTRQVCLMLLFNIMESTQETQEVKLKPTKELRSNPLKQALKCFVTANVCKYYEVASIRALLKQGDKNEIWEARQLMEAILTNEQRVVGFFSCGTALSQKVKGDSEEVPGLAFWVIFDWPEYGLNAFENYLSKLILKTGLDLLSCKAVRGRSK